MGKDVIIACDFSSAKTLLIFLINSQMKNLL